METGVSESDEGVMEFDGSYGIFGVGECETESEEVEARVSGVKAEDLRLGGGNVDVDVGIIAEEVRVSSELGSIKEKLDDEASDAKPKNSLSNNGGDGNFHGGVHSETRVSYGGRKSDMEVVKGERGSDFSSSYPGFHDIGNVETSEVVLEAARGLSYQFEVGDMVWGKVKSHPWWPGHIFNEAFASASVRRMRCEGHLLVAFFGDSSYGWFDPAELIPFEPYFAEKSKQTNSRSFVKAVEEAVDEASRRSALGLACRCRFPFNFRPSSVQGYSVVDVFDYEPGGVYSGKQIKKARDSFRSAEALSFVKQLALTPCDGDHENIDQIKNVSILLAYRKAVFEEFDETYAQAFGVEPVRPSRNAFGELEQPDRVLPRAPLSGPLVIAENLGERKSSVKSLKAKDSSKKYQFKRRDEPNESKVAKQGLNQASQRQIPSLAFKEGSGKASASLPSRAGDYVLQKRAPVFPEKHSFPMKQEEREVASRRQGEPVNVLGSVESQGRVSPTVVSVDFHMQGGFEEETLPMQPVFKERDASLRMTGIMDTDKIVRTTSITSDLGKSESLGTVDGVGRAVGREVEAVFVGDRHQPNQVMEDSRVRSLSVPADGPLHGDALVTPSGNAVVGKTSKARKRRFGEDDFSLDKHVMGEKRKKKDLSLETSLDQQHKQPKIVKDRETLRKLAGKSIGIGSANKEHQPTGSKIKDGTIFDSANMLPKLDIVNVELKLPQLVNDLLDIAVNPFHAIEHDNPAVVRHVFLKFRSRVYQKSLVLQPTSEPVVSKHGTAKSVTVRSLSDGNAELTSTVGGRETPASKSLKQFSRFEDPTKMGQKRGPSERQVELGEKRPKNLKSMKLLAREKKASNQKALDGSRGQPKETGASAPVARTEPTKKPELPPKATSPTVLVLKFQPETTLPSTMQLKAGFARFGPLCEVATRTYWKTFTCKVFFKYKSDAQAAYNYAIQNRSLFGQGRVRYSLRDYIPPTSALPELKMGQVNDNRLTPLAHQQRQPAPQLKSCLKKPPVNEAGPTAGVGAAKESPRVKFSLGGEETRGKQMMEFNSSISNTGSTVDGAPSSPMLLNVNLKSIKPELILPFPPQPFPSWNHDLRQFSPPPQLSQPFLHQPWILTRPPFFHPPPDVHESRGHFSKAPQNATLHAQYKEGRGKESMVDISQPMLSLLRRCSDIVNSIKSTFGYVPYRPL